MKIIISCGKISLLLFFAFLLVIVFVFSFITVYDSGKIILNNEQSRIEFLRKCGFNDINLATEPKEIIIPTNPTDEYKLYLQEHKNNGWNLYKYSGKELRLYSYKNDQKIVNLFFYNNVLVGGDYCEIGDTDLKPLNFTDNDRKTG